ncbi:hypothetical protein KHC33_05810 [Methanospirillum sp. J.3.6.1-F.2.7.3]|uniref:Uncharacterized protein n=1 Tax=Methanospirillum purgamenti TaxID=2834276 RepID=A0A8E7B088_9EURY|nr:MULTISPECIES: hypothetical protein [Methanospirillum]MDX8549873.1 hypothetical protein [Methanospirillum hungatei]QVV90010.1 hypothetical protein KHC33_05810 [Methanospirillum sp. J.3.6.1-F.2.7.3]
MAVNMGRGIGSDIREQFLTLKVMANNIKSQEQFLMMVDRQDIIPDMARRLSKEAVSSDLISNKRVLLDFLYNMLVRTGPDEPHMDVEFHYIIIGKGFFEVDKSVLWMEDVELSIPFEIGDKFGKKIVGEDVTDAVKKIMAFYKEAEFRFDQEQFGNLERCSLLILEEHYPQSSWQIRMRLPAKILNDYPVSI